jgi:hypothetical protein
VIALAAYQHLLTGFCSRNLEVFGNNALKRILGDRNIKKEGGCSRDFVAQLTLDLELHGSNYYKAFRYIEKYSLVNPPRFPWKKDRKGTKRIVHTVLLANGNGYEPP